METLEGHNWKILVGDCREGLRTLPDASVQCCVTSPPYYALRDYGYDGQIGLEETPEAYVAALVDVFREVRRVLRDDGTLWLNLGDSYFGSWGNYGGQNRGNGSQREIVSGSAAPNPAYDGLESWRPPTSFKHDSIKPKDLMGIPWAVAFALRADGWYLRSDIIWHKPNPMPESVTDRPTKSHEYLFLLSKSAKYFYDAEAISEKAEIPNGTHVTSEKSFGTQAAGAKVSPSGNQIPGKEWSWGSTRNRRSVWPIALQPYSEAHFACFPTELPLTCIKAGASAKGCCPDCGAPWKRIVEKDRQPTRPGRNNVSDETGMANRDEQRHVTSTVTKGWEPSCNCGNPSTAPCVVLDPFAGSGTTIRAANLLGHYGIGCEANSEYAQMAVRRITKRESPVKQAEPIAGQKALF